MESYAAFIGGLALVGLLTFIKLAKSFLNLCPPNEVLIIYGRNRRMRDGTRSGYRLIFGGRGWRIPVLESVHRMNLNLMEVPISIRGAYSSGGVPLNVDAIANVKISSDETVIANAVERFLGQPPEAIRRVAKETLEGHLRGVLARLTPEEVNEDRLKFADELTRESELDLSKLGIHLDTLKIQHVSDDMSYLNSIGREAIANVIKDAEIAESDAKRLAELAEAENLARGNVAKNNAEAQIARMKNDLRRIMADLESNVRAEEERTTAAAREARAKAEQELQQFRVTLETIRLQVEQILPAEARRVAQEFIAKGDAAILKERGAAVGQSIDVMNAAWKDAGEHALSIYLIEEIEKIIRSAAEGVAKIKVDSIQVIDSGNGQVLSSYLSNYPQMLNTILSSVAETTGIDVKKSIRSMTENSTPEVKPS